MAAVDSLSNWAPLFPHHLSAMRPDISREVASCFSKDGVTPNRLGVGMDNGTDLLDFAIE